MKVLVTRTIEVDQWLSDRFLLIYAMRISTKRLNRFRDIICDADESI